MKSIRLSKILLMDDGSGIVSFSSTESSPRRKYEHSVDLLCCNLPYFLEIESFYGEVFSAEASAGLNPAESIQSFWANANSVRSSGPDKSTRVGPRMLSRTKIDLM
jgi:hypothetical protein